MAESSDPSPNPKPSSPPPPPPPAKSPDRDFLLHLEAYLARRDGVDKLLKISRYAAKIALASPSVSKTLAPRLKSFESSVGLSRKAFRLGKFVQDINALRAAGTLASSPYDRLLAALAYGGEGIYYFVEQFVWLSKTGLFHSDLLPRLQKISAWLELIGYFGSITLKTKEIRKIQSLIGLEIERSNFEKIEILREKLLLKQLSIVQDLADGLMVIGDVRDGKGLFTTPLLMSSAGLLSALISTHKNWTSC